MKVLINLQTMQFVYKYANAKVLAELAYIEVRPDPYLVDDSEAKSFLSTLTDMEMKMLYRNITGAEIHFLGASLRGILSEIIDRMPVVEANGFEVEIQASKIEENDKNKYRYARGAYVASVSQELFAGFKAARNENEPLVAAQRRQRYHDTRLAPTHAATSTVIRAPGRVVPTTAATPAQRPPAAPRQSGVKDVIWRIADEMWDKAGKPKDLSAVLKLRKNIMIELESNHQVKKNTSSNELGKWQSNRLAP